MATMHICYHLMVKFINNGTSFSPGGGKLCLILESNFVSSSNTNHIDFTWPIGSISFQILTTFLVENDSVKLKKNVQVLFKRIKDTLLSYDI